MFIGNLLNSSSNLNQPYEYVGREGYYREAVFNLYLLGQRWYDSEVGRFISRDPIGEKGGINLYEYVRNNSTNLIDPYGLFCIPISTGSAESFWGKTRIVWINGLSPTLYIEIISISLPSQGSSEVPLGDAVICHWHAKIRKGGILIRTRVTEWLCFKRCPLRIYTKITTHQKTLPISEEKWVSESVGPLSVPFGLTPKEVCKMHPPSFIKEAEGYE